MNKTNLSLCIFILSTIVNVSQAITEEIIYAHPVIEKAFTNLMGLNYDFTVLNPKAEARDTLSPGEKELIGLNSILIYGTEHTGIKEDLNPNFAINISENDEIVDKRFDYIWTSPADMFSSISRRADTLISILDEIEIDKTNLKVWENRLEVLENQIKSTLRSVKHKSFADFSGTLELFSLRYGLRYTQSFRSWADATNPKMIGNTSDSLDMDEFDSYLRYLSNRRVRIILYESDSFTQKMKLKAAKMGFRTARFELLEPTFEKNSYEQIILSISKRLKLIL